MMKQVYLITFSSIYFIEKGRETLTDASLWVGDDPLHYFFWCGVGAKLKSLTRGRSSLLYFLPSYPPIHTIHYTCSTFMDPAPLLFPFIFIPSKLLLPKKEGWSPPPSFHQLLFIGHPISIYYMHIIGS